MCCGHSSILQARYIQVAATSDGSVDRILFLRIADSNKEKCVSYRGSSSLNLCIRVLFLSLTSIQRNSLCVKPLEIYNGCRHDLLPKLEPLSNLANDYFCFANRDKLAVVLPTCGLIMSLKGVQTPHTVVVPHLDLCKCRNVHIFQIFPHGLIKTPPIQDPVIPEIDTRNGIRERQ